MLERSWNKNLASDRRSLKFFVLLSVVCSCTRSSWGSIRQNTIASLLPSLWWQVLRIDTTRGISSQCSSVNISNPWNRSLSSSIDKPESKSQSKAKIQERERESKRFSKRLLKLGLSYSELICLVVTLAENNPDLTGLCFLKHPSLSLSFATISLSATRYRTRHRWPCDMSRCQLSYGGYPSVSFKIALQILDESMQGHQIYQIAIFLLICTILLSESADVTHHDVRVKLECWG